MNTRPFNKLVSIATLVIFLITPNLAFAQCGPGGCGNNGASAGLFGGGAGAGDSSGLVTGLLLGRMMSGGQGGGLGGAGGQGGGGAQIGQFLALAGLLSGNMGLMMAGMLTSMLGGLSGAGGQGATPQQGQFDERYVAPGQAGPYSQGGGYGAYSPYYTTPTPNPYASPTPSASACSQSIFIVKDTTANPVTTKPYPAVLTVNQSDCALVVNTDSADHSLSGNSVAKQSAQIFRFASKKVYNMCIDASSTLCTAVTVQ